ncbi:MAG: glutathione S-transferase [Alcanivorax sp.]|jgi:glutathione S-transferase
MNQIILHHFDISPFAEKVRLAFGIKNLPWQSVQIPLVMPKPDLTALTGGYRKTPVMQIGADIYCDTQRIARELERRFPQPTLFPHDSRALSIAFSQWSDAAFFQPGSGLSLGTNEGLPDDIMKDRSAFFSYLDFDTLQQELPHFYSQFCGHLYLLEDMLADGRQFLSGEAPGWMDILAYFPVWMGRGNIANAGNLLKPLGNLLEWEAKTAAIGHGHRCELGSNEALKIASDSISTAEAFILDDAWPSLKEGDPVSVTPTDYGDVAVAGTLLQLSHEDIAIRRTDVRAGELVIHFPRIGYRLEKQ